MDLIYLVNHFNIVSVEFYEVQVKKYLNSLKSLQVNFFLTIRSVFYLKIDPHSHEFVVYCGFSQQLLISTIKRFWDMILEIGAAVLNTFRDSTRLIRIPTAYCVFVWYFYCRYPLYWVTTRCSWVLSWYSEHWDPEKLLGQKYSQGVFYY